VAFDIAKQLIDSKAKVDAFVCLEAVACPEIGEIVSRANMTGKVKIVAMDTDQRTLTWIQKGVISATIAQKPYTMARCSLGTPPSSQSAFCKPSLRLSNVSE
jgi:ABC-type sugar transport system substrate-binding protein